MWRKEVLWSFSCLAHAYCLHTYSPLPPTSLLQAIVSFRPDLVACPACEETIYIPASFAEVGRELLCDLRDYHVALLCYDDVCSCASYSLAPPTPCRTQDNIECISCQHLFCEKCGSETHHPASCQSLRKWEEKEVCACVCMRVCADWLLTCWQY